MEKQYYGELCSLFYDLDKPEAPKEQMDFWMSYADKTMRILEPMCGSGRFLVPFLEQGYQIDGFDLSADMIHRCIEKLTSLGFSTRIDICDFNNFDTSIAKYDLIFIAAGSFSLLTDRDEVIKALQVMKNCLTPTGRIVLSVESDLPYRGIGETSMNQQQFELAAFEEGRRVGKDSVEVALRSKHAYDTDQQILYSMISYELYIDNKHVRTEYEDFHLRLYQPNEFDSIVEQCGFVIAHKYADFDKNNVDFQQAEEIYYELHK